MKRRLSAIVLALGMSLSVFSMGVYAAETETEAVTEQVTEAATEAVADAEAEEAATEAAEMTAEEYYASILTSYLTTVSAWTDEEIESLMTGDDATSASIAINWQSVKGELGSFVEVTDAAINEAGTAITGHAKYEGVDDKTTVTVTYSINDDGASATMEWEIDYPMSTLMTQAGLNTLMGLGIVFAALAFLALLISKLHIIPDMIEKRSKKNAPEAPKAAPAPVAAPVVEEEEYVDDLELVAVITAAIAASQNTSSDGFVVRSIKKANKRNWQRA